SLSRRIASIVVISAIGYSAAATSAAMRSSTSVKVEARLSARSANSGPSLRTRSSDRVKTNFNAARAELISAFDAFKTSLLSRSSGRGKPGAEARHVQRDVTPASPLDRMGCPPASATGCPTLPLVYHEPYKNASSVTSALVDERLDVAGPE